MLARQVALVTGASRGIGRGIALQLAEKGATVYATALPSDKEDSVVKSVADKLPTLVQTVAEMNRRGAAVGGRGIGVNCDHGNKNEVRRLFERITAEQDGRLDVLINNAFSAVTLMLKVMHKPFFELPEEVYDQVNAVGLRGHYMCSRQAARMMVPRRRGLIVTTSSPGGLNYIFNVAYGINKAGCDRLAADMAIELRDHNVCSVSLWPGAVRSELFMKCGLLNNATVGRLFQSGESLEMAGRCVAALAADPKRMEKSGHIITDMELAKEYGLWDDDGRQPFDPLSFKHLKFIRQLNEIRGQSSL